MEYGRAILKQMDKEEGLIDQDYLQEFFDGNSDLIHKMACVFVTTYTLETKTPLQLFSCGSYKRLRVWLHTLKSSARYVGAVSLSEQCEKQESIISQDELVSLQDIEEISSQLRSVVEYLDRG